MKNVGGTKHRTKATEQHAQESADTYSCSLLRHRCHWRNILEDQHLAAHDSSENGNAEAKWESGICNKYLFNIRANIKATRENIKEKKGI
jgi:hypothetical protein